MKNTIKVGMAACGSILALLVATSYAAAPSEDAVSLSKDEMVGGGYSIGPDGEAILSFVARPRGARTMISRGAGVATLGVNSGDLVGNYTEDGIQSVAFTFATDGHLPWAAVFVKTGTGTWLNENLNISEVAGEATLNSLSFERSAGCKRIRLNTAELWAEALTDVQAIGIRVMPLGQEAQVYTISDFMLIGPDGLQIPANLTPLAARLLKRFNRTSIAAAVALGAGDRDSDGDGMSDLDETLLDTEYFVAQVVESDQDTVIKWSSTVDATYKVYRAESLTDGFSLVATLTLPGSEIEVIEGESYWIDASAAGAGPYFYKVVVDITD